MIVFVDTDTMSFEELQKEQEEQDGNEDEGT